MNDWYDREIDAINEPYRPIPSGAISENEVIVNLKLRCLFQLPCFIIVLPFAKNLEGNHSNMGVAAWWSFSGWYIGHMGGYNTH